VFKEGVSLVEFQFVPAELVEIQGKLIPGVLMHPLQHQAAGQALQPGKLPAQLAEFRLAVVVQGHQGIGIGPGGFGEQAQLLLGLLLQKIQLERQDLQRGVHLVDNAQAAAAGAGVAVVAHQFPETPLQVGIGRCGLRLRGRHRDGVPTSGRGLRPGENPGHNHWGLGLPAGVNRNMVYSHEISRWLGPPPLTPSPSLDLEENRSPPGVP